MERSKIFFSFQKSRTARSRSVGSRLVDTFLYMIYYLNPFGFYLQIKNPSSVKRTKGNAACIRNLYAPPVTVRHRRELLAEARSRQSVRLSGTVCFADLRRGKRIAAAAFILRLGNDLHIYKPSGLTPSPDRFEAAICYSFLHSLCYIIIDEIISQHKKKVNSFPQPY